MFLRFLYYITNSRNNLIKNKKESRNWYTRSIKIAKEKRIIVLVNKTGTHEEAMSWTTLSGHLMAQRWEIDICAKYTDSLHFSFLILTNLCSFLFFSSYLLNRLINLFSLATNSLKDIMTKMNMLFDENRPAIFKHITTPKSMTA